MIGVLVASVVLASPPKLETIWTSQLQTEIQSTVIGEQSIFFGTNNSFGAIDQASGKKVWAKSVVSPQLGVYVAEGEGKVVASVGQGTVGAYDSKTGKPFWTLKRTGYGSPISILNQAVYGEVNEGKFSCLQLATGKPVWQSDLTGSPSCRPIRFNKSILVGTKAGRVFAFDKDTGKPIWENKERNAAVQALLVGEDRVHAIFDDGTILALSLQTGQKMWAVYTNNGLFGTPLFKDGRLFAMSVGGGFYSIAGINGEQLWKRALSYRQNFGLSQPMVWKDGFLIVDKSKLVNLDGSGEKVWDIETDAEWAGQQPRPLGTDVLLTGSHQIRRVRLVD